MRRKHYVALDQIPDPSPNPEKAMIEAEEQTAAEVRAAGITQKAGAFKTECRALDGGSQALVAPFLMDDDVPGRPCGRLSSAEVADLFDRTPNWVRVSKHLVRRKYPCAGGPSSCGGDQPACAHARGRKIFNRTLLKGLNRPPS